MGNILLNRTGALGDVLEVTAIARRLKYEGHNVFIKTNYPQVWHGSADAIVIGSPYEAIFDQVHDLNMAFENDLRKLHPIDSYSKVVFGDELTKRKIYFHFEPITTFVVNEKAISRPLAVLHPARSWPIRTLSRDFWQKLIDELAWVGFNVVLTGTRQDWDGLTNCQDLRSMLSLQQQASLIDFASVFICSESGPMILAQATTTPIIALLTMVEPHRIIHDDADITCIRAAITCVGCESIIGWPVKVVDCKWGPSSNLFRACCRDGMFDTGEITNIALTSTLEKTHD